MSVARLKSTVLGILIVGLMATFGTATASAESVTMKVSVIEASKHKGKKDHALRKIQNSLRRAFGGFKSFKQVDKHTLVLKKGASKRITLPNGQTAELRYKGKKGNQHKIRLTVPKSKVSVELRMKAGKMFYQAGLRAKKKGNIYVLGFYLRPKK